MAKSGSIYKQKNSKFFWIKYYLPGNPKPIRESTKTEVEEDAQNFLWRRLGEVATGKFVGLEPERVKVNDLLDMVIEDYETNERNTVYDLKCRIKAEIRPFFGHLKAAQVGTRQVAAYKSKRKKEGKKNATINRELAILRKAFSLGFAAEPQLVLKPLKVTLLEENNVRDGVISPGDYDTLRTSLPEPYRTFFVCGYRLGTRRGELVKVEWSEVDFEKKEIVLKRYNTKTKKRRVLPIYGDMEAYLKMAKDRRDTLYPKCPWVFQRKGERFKFSNNEWTRYVTRAGLAGKLFHDLRRTAITNMMEVGFSEKEAMEISGHKTDRVFRRYQIVSSRRVQKLGQMLEAALKTPGEAPGIVSGIEALGTSVN